jgi:hypothetical protein
VSPTVLRVRGYRFYFFSREESRDRAAGLDDSGIVPDPNDEQTVYLIPSYEGEEAAWPRGREDDEV